MDSSTDHANDPGPLDRLNRFDFRGLAPGVRFGTASDRYAGWIGQVYNETWESRVTSRKRRLGGQQYEERTVPVDSVAEYFEHFDVLELDFTFYRPLLDPDGSPGPNWFVLKRYADHAPERARFLLKAPQAYFARQLRRGPGKYEPNLEYLDAGECERRFLKPARELLGPRMLGIIFEQEYQRTKETPSAREYVAALDGFFGGLPEPGPYHIELRSPHLLVPPYPEWLAARGIGFVFSHWTWLPPLREQWRRTGERFTAADGEAVVRLLTPLRTPYAKAYATAHPFDRAVPELAESAMGLAMVTDAASIALQGAIQDATVNIIANNRAWGNAPLLAQAVARNMMDR